MLTDLQTLVQEIANQPFLVAAHNGSLNQQALRLWGEQMLTFACTAKRLMAQGLRYALQQNPPALETGVVLASNLYDEFGRGQTKCCHIHMLKNFLASLGYTTDQIQILPSTATCVAVHEAMGEEGLVPTLAAIWANELSCPIEFQAVRKSAEQIGLGPEALIYLDANLQADQEHCQGTWKILRPFVLNQGCVVGRAVERSINALNIFYQGLWQETAPLQAS